MVKTTNILLIEDNPADARLLQEHLNDLPDFVFELDHVSKLQEGRQIMAANTYHIVLLDLTLPDSQGINTVKQVVTEGLCMPVVVLSGVADEELAVQAVKEGAQDYLVKGEYDRRLLKRTIHYAIERNEIDYQLRQTQTKLQRALSELKEKQNKILEFEKLKSVQELAGAIAHEFAQPLQVLSNTLALMDNGQVPSKFIERCQRSISKIHELTANLQNITELKNKDYLDTKIIDIRHSMEA
ncbi:MAG: response regulator [Caldithrix sp.]|nr:response regulator [Caldithrix sp.]